VEASAAASPTPTPTPTPVPTPTPTPTPVPTRVIPLNGSYVEGDLDIANKDAHFQGSAPGLPGFAGEILEKGPYVYIRMPGETKYKMEGSSQLSIDPVDTTTGPVGVVKSILKVAADKRLQPELIGTESPLGESCYHIRVTVTPEVVNERLGLGGTAVANGSLDLWILQDGFNLQVLQFRSSNPAGGSVAIRLALSNFNAVAPIEAPPPEQFEIPGLMSQGY
jgi:hypothetical protein